MRASLGRFVQRYEDSLILYLYAREKKRKKAKILCSPSRLSEVSNCYCCCYGFVQRYESKRWEKDNNIHCGLCVCVGGGGGGGVCLSVWCFVGVVLVGLCSTCV